MKFYVTIATIMTEQDRGQNHLDSLSGALHESAVRRVQHAWNRAMLEGTASSAVNKILEAELELAMLKEKKGREPKDLELLEKAGLNTKEGRQARKTWFLSRRDRLTKQMDSLGSHLQAELSKTTFAAMIQVCNKALDLLEN